MVRLLRARALARLRPVDDPRCTPLPGEALGLWPVPAIPPRLASPAAPARARACAHPRGRGETSVNQQAQTGRGGFPGKSVSLQGHTRPGSVRAPGGLWGGVQSRPIAWGDVGGGAESGTAVTDPGWGDWRHRLEAERDGAGASREHVRSGYRQEEKEERTRQRLPGSRNGGLQETLPCEQEGWVRAAARLPRCRALGPAVPPEALGPRRQAHPIPLKGPVSATHTPSLPSQALALVCRVGASASQGSPRLPHRSFLNQRLRDRQPAETDKERPL